MVEPITLPRLAICFVPMIVLLVWLSRDRDRTLIWPTLQGLARMTIQLLCVGYLLVYLFDHSRPWLTLTALTVMLIAAATIAVRTGGEVDWMRWFLAASCLLLASTATLGIVLIFVLNLWPWQAPRTVIPLAGMTLSAAMNAISLAIERYDSETGKSERYDSETSKSEHYDSEASESVRYDSDIHEAPDRHLAAKRAFDAALIPMTNSLMAVGVVSIPGMMTGQVLAGVPPFIAARYQIMIMCLLFASAGLATKLFLTIEQRRFHR